jgi:hypothetical protein
VIAHPKVLLAGGMLASSGAALVSQALPATTPAQIAMVLAGLVAIGVGIGIVVSGYLWVHGWMKRTAREEVTTYFKDEKTQESIQETARAEVRTVIADHDKNAAKSTQEAVQQTARVEVKAALDDHSREAAQRTRVAVTEAITAAGNVQAQALKDHISEERAEFVAFRKQFAAIGEVLVGQNGRMEYMVDMLEYLKGGSSPSVKRLLTNPALPKLESSPGTKK